jgi:DNA-binding MarR family transcriptional regulator
MPDDFSDCLVSNTRMAARAVTRRDDALLRPHGITATQLSLLGGITDNPGRTVSELAERRGFERTTLTRNLQRLREMGLVASTPAGRGNGRTCTVTPKGRALVAELVPLWRAAQAGMREDLGAGDFEAALKVLRRLAAS